MQLAKTFLDIDSQKTVFNCITFNTDCNLTFTLILCRGAEDSDLAELKTLPTVKVGNNKIEESGSFK